MVAPGNNSVVRFGVFELDLDAGELRKSGVKIRLQGQPWQVLAVLLERAGEVVTRDDLRQKLWPSDTFVDFDHSLNTAVNKIREVLGDSASSPRYIETLPRRGYRFIAPVQNPSPVPSQVAGSADVPTNATAVVAAAPSAKPSPLPASIHPELEIPTPRRGIPRALFALIQVMYLIFYIVALFRLHAIQVIGDSFLPIWGATTLAAVIMITAGIGIPLRSYLISAVGFDYQRLSEKFRRIFPLLLALDQLWAIAPFLLIPKLGLGGAFAVSAALLYVPFSERSLIKMAYPEKRAG